MRACCGQQDACIRIGASADASLARSFFPCPVASLCQSAPCNFLAAADQACMLGKTSRISKCTMRGLEISSWSNRSVRTGAPSSLVLLLLEGSHDVHVYRRRPGSRVRLGRTRRTGPHRRWPSIANRSAKAIATTISCTIFHSINSRKCTTKNITVLAIARAAPRRERVL